MWFEKMENGSVRYRERYEDPLTGLSKSVSVTLPSASRLDQKKARLILEEKIRKVQAKRGDVKSLTFGELCGLYLQDKAHVVKPQSLHVIRVSTETLISRIGAGTLVSRLTAPVVRQAFASADPVWYNNKVKELKSLIRWAYRADLVGSADWVDKIEPLPETASRVKLAQKFLEPDEVVVLLNAMKNEQWHDMTELLVLSGLRVGEAVALTAQDVNMDARVLIIDKTMSTTIGELSSTKTSAGDRAVFIQDELVPVIERLLERSHGGALFTASYKAYFAYLRKVSREVLGRSVTPHYLRHTHVALMAAAGVSLDAIARRVGHESSRMTREVYFHVTRRLFEAEAEEIREKHLLSHDFMEQKWSKWSKKGANFAPFCPNLSEKQNPKKPVKSRKNAIS